MISISRTVPIILLVYSLVRASMDASGAAAIRANGKVEPGLCPRPPLDRRLRAFPLSWERSRRIIQSSLSGAHSLRYMRAKFGLVSCQPTIQVAMVIAQCVVLRSAFVSLPPLENILIGRKSRQGRLRQWRTTRGRPVSVCHWMSASGEGETI
jgi:hypothetical protein